MLGFTHKIAQAIDVASEEAAEKVAEKIEKAVELVSERAAEIAAEKVRAEIYQWWHEDWDRRRRAAEAKGVLFNDPPPLNPTEMSHYREGVQQGRSEVYRLWQEWDRRRREAEEKGISFTESPPANPYNGNRT